MEREQLGDDAVRNVEADIGGDPFEAYISDLNALDASQRLRAVIELQELREASGAEALKVLERMAARDPSRKVRAAAFSTLASPTYQELSRRRTQLGPITRRLIVQEIEGWVKDGVMPTTPANVLRARYT